MLKIITLGKFLNLFVITSPNRVLTGQCNWKMHIMPVLLESMHHVDVLWSIFLSCQLLFFFYEKV